MPEPQLKSGLLWGASLCGFLLVCLLEGGADPPPPTSYVWPRHWPTRPRTMTMQKLVSGIRLFTLSPRFTRLWSLREPPAQEILRSFSDAARAGRFAFNEGASAPVPSGGGARNQGKPPR